MHIAQRRRYAAHAPHHPARGTIKPEEASPLNAEVGRSLAALRDERLDWRFKAIPAAAHGLTVAEYLATGPRLADLGTPLMTLDESALAANLATMASYCATAGVGLAPHGKTTMAPALWARQLAAGARGITLANVPQLRVARAFRFPWLQLANALVDPAGLRWVSAELDADAGFDFVCWTDSAHGVGLMDSVLRAAGARRPVDVCVELGGLGGRTGVRDPDEAVAVARAVAAAPTLRLVGVSGYEGALEREAIDPYLRRVAELHGRLADAGLYADGVKPMVTAGGSSFFDQVVEALAPLGGPEADVVLRSGAYISHDDGFYRAISPFSRGTGPGPLRSAIHGWGRVVSRPEPGLAILDTGKRDLPFDEGLPMPQTVHGAVVSADVSAEVTAVKDQHTFVRLPDNAPVDVGDIMRLGLSHPCTAFDKWTMLPVLDDATGPDPAVVDLVRTFF